VVDTDLGGLIKGHHGLVEIPRYTGVIAHVGEKMVPCNRMRQI